MSADLRLSIILGAALAGGFSNIFNNAGSCVNKLQGKLSALGKDQGAIDKFGKLQGVMTQTAGKLNDARARVRELGEQMRASSEPSEGLRRKFGKAKEDAERLRISLGDQRRELGRLRETLGAAGVDTRNFSDEQARAAQSAELAARAERLRGARDRVATAQGNLDKTRQTLSGMKGDLIASAGIALALRAPVMAAANFEQAMAKVGAVSGASGEDFERLSAQARQLGKDTQYTAMAAAASQEALARAGFKTEEILAAMPGLLNMTAAEGMDLATAADIAASSLRGFNLPADQMDRVGDVLAKTSAITNTSISGLGESFKMVAPVAAGLKIPMEGVAAVIGVMGDAGIKGSEAGTALRASLVRLAKEPAQTAKALEKLGVKARDAGGNMRTLPALLADLGEKTEGLGTADKLGALSKVFGTEAAAGMLAAMEAAKTGRLRELTAELENAGGEAARMAAVMNDTAQGAMKRLSSATESLMIDVGNALLPAAREGVEGLAKLTGAASDAAQRYPRFTKAMVLGAGALGAYKVASTGVRIAVAAAKLPFEHVALAMAKYNAWLAATGEASLAVALKTKIAATATKVWTGIQAAFNAVMSANPVALVILAVAALAAAFVVAYNKSERFRNFVDSCWESMKSGAAAWAEWIGSAVNYVMDKWESMKSGMAAWAEAFGAAAETAKSYLGPLITLIDKLSAAWNNLMVMTGRDETATNRQVGTGRQMANLTVRRREMMERGEWNSGLEDSYQKVAKDSGYNLPTAHALGGIFTRPHVGLVAEAGTESVIPHNAGGEGIWRATGEMAGFSPAPGGGGAVFSPVINLTVRAAPGEDAGDAGRRIIRTLEEELPRLLKRFDERRARVAY